MRSPCSVMDDVWSRACVLAGQIFIFLSPLCVHVNPAATHTHTLQGAHADTVIDDPLWGLDGCQIL